MIVWINGAFGVGKTTVAAELSRRWPDALLFDPEAVGQVLGRVVPGDLRTNDFQDLRTWRQMVVTALHGLSDEFGRRLVVPMTVIDLGVFADTVGALRSRGLVVHHVALQASEATIRKRLRWRWSPGWALERVGRCVAALEQPEFAVHVDNDGPTVSAVADRIEAALQPGT